MALKTINDIIVRAGSCSNISTMSATLANIITNRNRLLAICNECAHTVELNIDQLVERHGVAYPVPVIKRRLKCIRCGSASCAVQVTI